MWDYKRPARLVCTWSMFGRGYNGDSKLVKAALPSLRPQLSFRISAEIGDCMIRKGTDQDFEEIFTIINDAAIAYKGVIPSDRWHDPYMTREDLRSEIEDGVEFSCYINNDEIIGVM